MFGRADGTGAMLTARTCEARIKGPLVLCAICASLLALTACQQRRAGRSEAAPAPAARQTPPPSLSMGGAKSVTRFFVTSRGLGRGGDLGGLAGADVHCQALASAEGSGDHTWHAYLSTMATKIGPAVNARDRIGKGPWYNALGDRIAADVDDLHSGTHLTPENVLTERGDPMNSDMAEILTGSRPDGTAFQHGEDVTCRNWTSNRAGRAQVGRLDANSPRKGSSPWNSVHPSRGCSQQDLEATGGSGLFYCFAID
jgi:hypothetical protein